MEAQAKASAGSNKDPDFGGAATEGSPSEKAQVADPEAIAHIIKIISQDRVIRGGVKSTREELARPQDLAESSDEAG